MMVFVVQFIVLWQDLFFAHRAWRMAHGMLKAQS